MALGESLKTDPAWSDVDGAGSTGQGLSAAAARIGDMTLCDYFSAPDDQAAVAVLQTPGGPGQTELDVVFLKNIDPVVAIAQLEAVITGCSYEEASNRPRSGQVLSEPEDGPPFVVSLSSTLIDALAAATQGDLVRFAEPWSATDELRHMGISSKDAAIVLKNLAGLAERAQASGQRLYCWWAL
ncbi:hypothetical protein [Streptomyces zaomyceticus]|uniref:hypothetical protein n=2 Tax=Streptomyces zaomyceticus TaxID=68286 RepID=UPI00339ECB0A